MMDGYRLKIGSEVLSLPREVLPHLADASDTDLRVLLLLAAEVGEEEITSSFGIEPAEISASAAFWRGAGMLTRQKKPKGKTQSDAKENEKAPEQDKKAEEVSSDKTAAASDGKHGDMTEVLDRLPDYTSDEVKRLCESDRVLRSVFDEAQQIWGKVFNNLELNYILAMRDHLGLDGEYILMLLQHFRAEGKPLCYAVRTADSLVKNGVDTPALLEEYIRKRDMMRGNEGQYRDLFGIGSRQLTSYEEKYFSLWTEQKIPYELLKLAFDRTVEKKGTPQKSYISGILARWTAAGYRNEADVLAAEEAERAVRTLTGKGTAAGKKETPRRDAPAQKSAGSFDVDDFLNAALERTYGKKD